MLYDMSINAERVRTLRESRGWSQEHLAEVAGLSLRTIQRVEAEGRGSRETKLSLAAAFDVPLGRLCVSGPAAEARVEDGEAVGVTLTFVGTVVVIVGLMANLNPVLLVSGSALLLSALVLHALDYLNGMRRAAGLPPLVGSPSAVSGLAVLVAGSAVVALGYAVSGQPWWMPGGVLMTFGLTSMAWPRIVRKLVGAKGGGPEGTTSRD